MLFFQCRLKLCNFAGVPFQPCVPTSQVIILIIFGFYHSAKFLLFAVVLIKMVLKLTSLVFELFGSSLPVLYILSQFVYVLFELVHYLFAFIYFNFIVSIVVYFGVQLQFLVLKSLYIVVFRSEKVIQSFLFLGHDINFIRQILDLYFGISEVTQSLLHPSLLGPIVINLVRIITNHSIQSFKLFRNNPILPISLLKLIFKITINAHIFFSFFKNKLHLFVVLYLVIKFVLQRFLFPVYIRIVCKDAFNFNVFSLPVLDLAESSFQNSIDSVIFGLHHVYS